MYGPTLHGERLILRPHRIEDAQAFVSMLADLEVTKYLARQLPLTLEAEQEWLQARGTDPASIGWTIEVEDRPVGVTGLDQINWELGTATIGTFIGDKALWGQGIATEMGRLVASYVFTHTPLRKIKAGYIADNEASGRLQASAGLVEVGRWHKEFFRSGKWCDHVLTELLREDWEQAQAESALAG